MRPPLSIIGRTARAPHLAGRLSSNVRQQTTRAPGTHTPQIPPMTKLQTLAVASVFALAGLGLYALTATTSAQRAESCERVCAAQGKVFIVAPAGTAGRMVDGNTTKDELSSVCRCVEGPVAP